MSRYRKADYLRCRENWQPFAPDALCECWLIGEEDHAEGRECSPPVGCTEEEARAYRVGYHMAESERVISLYDDQGATR